VDGGAEGIRASGGQSSERRYAPEQVDLVLITHMHSDHIEVDYARWQRVFSNADVLCCEAENDFWLSPEIAAKAPKEAQEFFPSRPSHLRAYIKAGKWHTFSVQMKSRGNKTVPLPGHTPDIPVTNSAPKAKRFCSGATSFMP